jgi:hypothetical protein
MALRALRRAIAELKQHWSVIGSVTINLLSRAPHCFGRHVKPLVWHWARVMDLYVIHKEGLCPRSGYINRLMTGRNISDVTGGKRIAV